MTQPVVPAALTELLRGPKGVVPGGPVTVSATVFVPTDDGGNPLPLNWMTAVGGDPAAGGMIVSVGPGAPLTCAEIAAGTVAERMTGVA
jgi:hypothetical protein